MKLYYFPSLVKMAQSFQGIPLYTAGQVDEMTDAEKTVIKEVDEGAIAHFQKTGIKFYFAQTVGSLEECRNLEAQISEFRANNSPLSPWEL